MKILTKTLHIGFVLQLLNAYLFGARFDFPAGTPGLQADIVLPLNNLNFKHIFIPNTNCHLYFPADGSQPDTADAGAWSGARNTGQLNDISVTDWWARVFGGNNAVNLSRVGAPDVLAEPRMGFNAAGVAHIIQVAAGVPIVFEQQFWQTFRDIASDQVGRVLLYRLLIEIRRKDDAGRDGCCGDDVLLPFGYNLNKRNVFRNIDIIHGNAFGFSGNKRNIKFKHDDTKVSTILSVSAKSKLKIKKESRPTDIGLFHEMIHWFHQLRNPNKKQDNESKDPTSYKYAKRCYSGNSFDMKDWDNAEKLATILGSPTLNTKSPWSIKLWMSPDAFSTTPFTNGTTITIKNQTRYINNFYKFVNGDDLSENVYRASREQHMRWGHKSFIYIKSVVWPNIPNCFRLAHKVAYKCYQIITGTPPQNWKFILGQAIGQTIILTAFCLISI